MGKIGDLWVRLGLKDSEFKKGMKNAEKTGGGLAQALKRNWLSVTAGITAAAAAIRGFANAYKRIADFEQANVNLATILGKNVSEISQMTNSAKELGRTTAYTASQVTELQTELAKLGFNENQIMNMQKAVLNFSTAVGTDLASAASFAGSTLRIFGLTSEQTQETLDILATATTKSALNFSYLQTAMSIVGPVAKTFGFEVKDVTALLGTLANAGFDASSAATATRNILLNLANANGKLAKALGHNVTNLDELLDGLQELRNSGVDLNTTLALTDKRSVAAFNTFLDGAEATRQLATELEAVDGAADRIANERLQTVSGSIKIMQSAWEGFILSMSNSTGVIKSVIDKLTELINLSNFSFFQGTRVDEYAAAFKQTNQASIDKYGEAFTKQYMQKQIAELEKKARDEKAANYNGNFLNRLLQGKKTTEYYQEQLAALKQAYNELFQEKATELAAPTGNDDGGNGDGTGDLDDILQKAKKDAEKKRAEDIAKQAAESQRTERENLVNHYKENLALLQKYGLDTEDLTKQFHDKLLEIDIKAFDRENAELEKALDRMAESYADFEADMSVADDITESILAPYINAVEEGKALAYEFRQAVVSGFIDASQEMMDQFMGLSDVNPGAIFKALLEPLADLAIREGEILLMTGAGVEACKTALESLNGIPALVAGAALVAIGTAAKSGLAALANGGSKATGANTTSTGSGTLNQANINTELTVVVTGRISGSDILISGQRTQRALNR